MRCNKAGVFIRYSGLVLFRFSRKSEGIFMHLTPLLRNYCFFGVSPIFLTQYPVMLRDTAGEKVRMFLSCCIETLSDCNEIRNVLYSSSAHECAIGEVSRSDGGVGFYQKSIQLFFNPSPKKTIVSSL